MEEVRVLVRFGGTWETSAEGQYAYKGGRLRGMKITKGIAYNDFVEELYRTIEVDANEYDLKMEVLWRSSSMPLPPMEICNDTDLCFFLDGVIGSANDFIPLCVTLVSKVSTIPASKSPAHQISNCHTHCISGSGSNQIDSTMPSLNEAELETNPSSVPVMTLEEQLPKSQPQMPPPPLSQGPTLDNNDEADGPQGNPNHVDGIATNTGDGFAAWDEEGVLEGNKKGNQVKDDVPVDNVNVSRQNVMNAKPSKRFSYLPYLPDCDNDTTSVTDNDALFVGQTFLSKKELQKRLGLHAVKNHYQFKVSKSSTKRFEAICMDKNCKWRARAVKITETDNFELRRLDQHHTCATDQAAVGHRRATSWFIGDYVKERLLGKQCKYKPEEIRQDIRTDYGIELSYTTCRRARESAIKQIKESLENSNALFPSSDEKVVRRKRHPSGTTQKMDDPGSIAQKKCRQCGTFGHNRQTCKNPTPPLSSCEGKTEP